MPSVKTNRDAPPPILPLLVENLPDEIRNLNRFVLWTWTWKKTKWDKPPTNAAGIGISYTDKRKHLSFADALKQVHKVSGIGLVFTDGIKLTGDAGDLIAFDIDNCRDPASGEITWSVANQILEACQSYAESTPSGEGIRVYVAGQWPLPQGKVTLYGGKGESGPSIEGFHHTGYATLTGQKLERSGEGINRNQEAIDYIFDLAKHASPDSFPLPFVDQSDKFLFPEGKTQVEYDYDPVAVRSALNSLPQSFCDDYNQWIRVGMMLHSTNDPEMLSSFLTWSRRSEKYQKGCCEKLWNSLKGREGTGAITIRSLFFHAIQSGWTYQAIGGTLKGELHIVEKAHEAIAELSSLAPAAIQKVREKIERDNENAAKPLPASEMTLLFEKAVEHAKALQTEKPDGTPGKSSPAATFDPVMKWKLTIWKSDPPVYEIEVPEGNGAKIRISLAEWYSFGKFRLAYHGVTGLSLPRKMAKRWSEPRGYCERLVARAEIYEVPDEENPRRAAIFIVADWLRSATLVDRDGLGFSPERKPQRTKNGQIWFSVRALWADLRYELRDCGFTNTKMTQLLKSDLKCQNVKISLRGRDIRAWIAEELCLEEITYFQKGTSPDVGKGQ